MNGIIVYGLSVIQAVVTSIVGNLLLTRDRAKGRGSTNPIRKTTAEREFYSAKKAKGEADKAEERAKLEKNKFSNYKSGNRS